MAAVGAGVAPPVVTERWAVSVPEAAKLLGVSRTLLYQAVRRGEIPAQTIGGRLVIPVEAMQGWLAGGRATTDKED